MRKRKFEAGIETLNIGGLLVLICPIFTKIAGSDVVTVSPIK
jgi:hypothetical protein